MVTVPVSFQFNIPIKDGNGKKTKVHGILSKKGEWNVNSDKSKEEKEWLKVASGNRAEQKIFDKLQEIFSDKPCLLVNGFCENFLIKVAKEKIPKRKTGIKLSDQVKIS